MRLKIKVIPNSKEERVEELEDGSLKIKVREKAIEGLANSKVREILAKRFGIPKSEIKLKGERSRNKIVYIGE